MGVGPPLGVRAGRAGTSSQPTNFAGDRNQFPSGSTAAIKACDPATNQTGAFAPVPIGVATNVLTDGTTSRKAASGVGAPCVLAWCGKTAMSSTGS